MGNALAVVGKPSKGIRNSVTTFVRRAIESAKRKSKNINKDEIVRIARKARAKWNSTHGLSKGGSAAAIAASGAVGAGAGTLAGRKKKKEDEE